MLIGTWNINSVRARLERLCAYLAARAPHVLCLQETKVRDDAFPYEAIGEAGYHAVACGQKSYNGVAILAREPVEAVRCGFDQGEWDAQARLIAGRVAGITILSAYVPNGGEVGSEKFAYKLAWMEQLLGRLDSAYSPEEPLILCGDLNCFVDDADAKNPRKWEETCLGDAAVRRRLAAIREWGLSDLFRKHHPDGGVYSWWDYRNLAFPKHDGVRIDHLYGTAPAAQRCTDATVDRDQRKGKKPSDHAPVLIELDG